MSATKCRAVVSCWWKSAGVRLSSTWTRESRLDLPRLLPWGSWKCVGTLPPPADCSLLPEPAAPAPLRDSPLLTDDLWATPGWHEQLLAARRLLRLGEQSLNKRLFSGPELRLVASKLGECGVDDHALSRLAHLRQLEPRAVLTLLVCAAGGPADAACQERQRTLAATAELMHAASLMHRSVDERAVVCSALDRLLLLGGDLLFTRAFGNLSGLRNNVVFELLSQTVAHMTQGELQPPAAGLDAWAWRHHQLSGSQLAHSCQGGLLLARSPLAAVGHQLGRCLSLAWQARADIHHVQSGRQLRLTALPVALGDVEQLAEWSREQQCGGLTEGQQARVREVLAQTGALRRAEEVLRSYIRESQQQLNMFPDSEAKNAIDRIILQLLP